MPCPAVVTGKDFLASTLSHVDCQAQTLGSYGYLVLSQPGSMASLALTGLLTLFIALFGLRLLFGPSPTASDTIRDLLKAGIVMTLALSWPAWRTVVYQVTLQAPAAITASISPSTLPATRTGFPARLQNIDTGMIALTARGSGRNIGELTAQTAPPAGFRGVALDDETGFASARLIYLAGTIGSLAIVRLAAGLLLALTPLAAGCLLFEATRGLFSGWARGLVLTMLGSVGITIVLAAELALLEPWLADALRLRDLGYATPAAPTELLALTAAFSLVLFGMLVVLGRVAFHRGWPSFPALPQLERSFFRGSEPARGELRPLAAASDPPTRAFLLSDRMSRTVRQEEQTRRLLTSPPDNPQGGGRQTSAPADAHRGPSLKSGGGRIVRRTSLAAARRDARS